jgi:hypothetical protein
MGNPNGPNTNGNPNGNDLGDGLGDLADPDLGDGPDQQFYAPNKSGLATAQGGGGAGLPGGGGGMSGDSGGPGGRGGGGIPNGIIQGQKSGSGYVPSYARSGGSGGGYSGGKRGPASTGKAFNLKDYLPGGKLAPKRSIASLSGHPEVASKTSNIFGSISARYREICLKGRLYECDKIIKPRR